MAQYKTFKTMSEDKLNPPNTSQNQDTNSVQIPNISSLQHRKDLIQQNLLVVIDNYTDWCGPCKQCAPHFANIASKYARPGLCVLVKENVEHGFGGQPIPVRGVPCFHFYMNGQFLQDDIIVGADTQNIENTIKRLLNTVNK